LPNGIPNQKQYQYQEQKQEPKEYRDRSKQKSKNGSRDEGRRSEKAGIDGKELLSIAREVLKLTSPNAPLDDLYDTFRGIHPDDTISKSSIIAALNEALSERRAVS
jgi:hypothetical protein